MKDLEGDLLEVDMIPYSGIPGRTICIHHKGMGDLIPLSKDQALQLARKLIKAAMD